MQTNAANFSEVELIGSGGMGKVYRAFDATMNRTVAIKVMTLSANDAQHVKRFMREAQAMSRLDHPNITKVYRVGQNDNLQPYMVLEYVEGESLAALLKRESRLPEPKAIELFKQLASALACAHSQGIVHRDVKPSNVLVSGAVAKLADFGIARDLMRTTQATAPGMLMGSPMYASPEQCAGEAVDARSDIYSLGCLMFEVLSGKRPFEAEDLFSLAMMHQTDAPPQLTEVAPGLNRVVQRCLMKNRADRFADGSELLKALEAGDTNLVVAVPSKGAIKPRSATAPIAIGAAIATTLCVAFVLYLPRPQANEPSDRAEQFTAESARMHYEEAKACVGTERKRKLIRAEAEYAKLGEEPGINQHDILFSLGHVRRDLGRSGEAATAFEKAIQVRQANGRSRVPWDWYHSLAVAYVESQQYVKAETPLKVAIAEGAREKDKFFCWFSDFWLGVAREKQEDYPNALRYFRQALKEDGVSQEVRERSTEHIAAILREHPELK
jgi:hypothetical protein